MIIFKNGMINAGGALIKRDLAVADGVFTDISETIENYPDKAHVIDLKGLFVMPGGVDVHVHLRDPGFTDKETVQTGTKAASAGGITAVMAMPNTNPVTDTADRVIKVIEKAEKCGSVRVFPFCAVTVGEKGEQLTDIENISQTVKGFSDDGKGVTNLSLLREAMIQTKAADSIIASHLEAPGCGLLPEAEIRALKDELELVRETGAKYHFCHLSLKKSFELLKEARREGLDVTAEVTPHHLFLTECEIKDANYKMSPPLRTAEDTKSAIDAIKSGVVTMIATDHAPHTESEKAKIFNDAPNGIIGLETLIPTVYTYLVKTGIISFDDMENLITVNPAKRFGIPYGEIKVGGLCDITAIDIDKPKVYKKQDIISKGKNSPFIGRSLYGFPKLTAVGGKIVFNALTEAENE